LCLFNGITHSWSFHKTGIIPTKLLTLEFYFSHFKKLTIDHGVMAIFAKTFFAQQKASQVWKYFIDSTDGKISAYLISFQEICT